MTTVHTTTCPLDCPDTCSLDVEIDADRVTAIRAGAANPVTRGFICSKVTHFAKRLDHDTRLTHPLRRVGAKGEGRFERIGWDEAIDRIVAEFIRIRDRWGGEAILPYHYGGSNGKLTDGFLDRLFFARLGASRLAKTICAAPTGAVAQEMYGKMAGVAYQDYPAAKCIIVWGANPKACAIHLVPFLREAKANGAHLIVVDPRCNFSDREIDQWLPVVPGGDLPLALGLIREWERGGRLDRGFLEAHADGVEPLLAEAAQWPLERAAAASGVDAEAIARTAAVFADADPALIRMGWGPERNRNGGQAVAAVLAMPALLGKFGVPGGGYTMSNNAVFPTDLDGLLGNGAWSTREINMTRLAALLHDEPDPPLRGLFVYNCNPVASVPDQQGVIAGLSRDDVFTVVFDQVMTDTAAFADIVLPATTFLEHDDIRVSYGTYVMGGIRPVIPPRGEARPNAEVFAALGRAMGFDDAPFQWSPEEYVERMARATALGSVRGDARALAEGGLQSRTFDGERPVQFVNAYPATADGKVHLTPAVLGDRPYRFEPVVDPDYPLALISPASAKLVSTMFGESSESVLAVTMHPDDAAARDVTDGDPVRVFNANATVECRARVRTTVRPGVVSIPKGVWRRASRNGLTSTALSPAHVNVVAGGACFNDARVEVARG